MKKRCMFRSVLSILVILSMLASIPVFAQEPEGEQQYTITEPYEYPVVPGTPEWEAFTTHQEMIDVCQIPDEILSNMTTGALLQSVLDYPLMIDMLAMNSKAKGFDHVLQYCNALQELIQREDYATTLADYYTSYQSALSRASFTDDSFFTMTYMEILLAVAPKIETLELQKADALETAVETYYNNRELYETAGGTYYSILAEQQGIQPYMTDVWIKTPNGYDVEVQYLGPEEEYYSNDIIRLDRQTAIDYPMATKIFPASTRYNCHNWAWNTTAPKKYCMLDPTPYMIDESHYEVFSPKANDKVFYIGEDHSATLIRISGPTDYWTSYIVKSKWGGLGAYQHSASYGPHAEYMTSLEFWRRA